MRDVPALPPNPSRPTLSVCIAPGGTPRQLAAVLDGLRDAADEIVVGIAPGASDRDERRRRRLADRVVRVGDEAPGAHPSALLAACTGDWTLRLAADEVVSAALTRRLPALVADPVLAHWAIRRRWLLRDRFHWLDELPWAPDFELRLGRTGVIAATDGRAPVGHVDEPIYNLDCLVTSVEDRRARALVAEVVRLGAVGEGGRAEHRLYDPERFASLPPVEVPGEDRAALSRWFGSRTEAHAMTRGEPSRPSASSPDATVTCLERDLRFHAGEQRAVTFDVTNTSTAVWPAGGAPTKPIFATYRWRWADGRLQDGPRTAFPVEVAPGATITLPVWIVAPAVAGHPDLVVDVVEEHVRWYDAKLSLRAQVLPLVGPPDRRTAAAVERGALRRRPTRRRQSLPKVIHHVWLGGGAPPAHHDAYMESWRVHNPDWQVRLWTDADAPVPAAAHRARNIAERADLVRYEILRRYGGVYADTDVECLRPIAPLVGRTRVFAGYEIPGRLCNAVMGGLPGHRAFQRLVDLAETTVGIGDYPSATATVFLTRVLEPEPEATLFGPELFYPYLWDEPRPTHTSFPNSYAVHHWAMSWVAD